VRVRLRLREMGREKRKMEDGTMEGVVIRKSVCERVKGPASRRRREEERDGQSRVRV